MIKKEFQLGKKLVEIMFTHKPYYESDNTIVMGFPYNMDVSNFDKTKVNETKGYYVYLKYDNDKLTIINDIIGNYRTYYMEYDNVLYISNDFLYLFNILPKDERIPNKFELNYWEKHRFTTGGESICAKIHKIKPAHIYKICDNNIEEKTYFKVIENKPNRQKHCEEVLADLRDTAQIIKQMPQKKFLLFSGGADSTLCVKVLQEAGIEFTPVFAKHEPTNVMNFDDTLKIKYSTQKLGIEPLEIKIDTTKELSESVVDIMFQDMNITQLFFVVAKELRKRYGEDIILINGQGSDLIFAFAPTGSNYGDYIARNIMFSDNFIKNKFYEWILHVSKDMYKNMRLPKKKELLEAFFDFYYFKPLIEEKKGEEYFSHIRKIIKQYSNLFKDKYNIMMYLNIYGFMQGSDNYVNVQSSEYEHLHSVFLIDTPRIIYSTVKNQDYQYEIKHPKSVVYKILKDVYNYEMPNFKKEKNYKKNVKKEKNFNQYEREIHQAFFDKVNSLEFSEEVKV